MWTCRLAISVLDTVTGENLTLIFYHLFRHSVYRKWNERLFREMHAAYKAGRAAKDPSEFWYQGEIGFFDFYM